MANIAGGSVVWNLDIDNSKFNSGLKKASSDVKSNADKIEKDISKSANSSADSFSSAMGRIAKSAAVGFAAAGAAAGAMFVSAIKATANLEQSLGGSQVVFGEFATGIQKTAQDSAAKMGTSMNQYLETANKMGSLFQGAGFSVKESTDLTTGAMQRATDVATAMGVSTEMALESIAGAAKGNFTMMDNLGVAMNETTLNAFALEKGLSKTVGEMTNSEKVGLAMQLFMEKTGKFAGNYAKENDTLAGSFQTLKSAWTNVLGGVEGSEEQLKSALGNMVAVLGEALPQIFNSLRDSVANLWGSFVEANPQITTMLEILKQVGVVIGVLLIPAMIRYIALQTLAGVNALIAGAKMLAGWLMALGPIGLIMAAVGAVAALIIMNWDKVKGWLSSFWNWLKGIFSAGLDWIKRNWLNIVMFLGGPIGIAVGLIIKNFDKIKSVIGGVINWVKGSFSTIAAIGTSILKGAVNSLIGFAENTINGFINLINGAIGAINKIPGVNIGKIGNLTIPRLAEGGIVPATSGGRLAVIGEGGEDEAVIPLSKLAQMDFGGGGSSSTVINIDMSGVMARSRTDLRDIAVDLVESINEGLRSKNLPELGGGKILEVASNG
jgi:hypothetical protein